MRTSPSTARAVVDLPEPLSPTMASVSPGIRSKSTPSTACTAPVARLKKPALDGKPHDQTVDLQGRFGACVLFAPPVGTRRAAVGEMRHGVQQMLGVGMLRVVEDLVQLALLHGLAVLHHHDLVGDAGRPGRCRG